MPDIQADPIPSNSFALRPQPGGTNSAPILSAADLDDPTKFVSVGPVPYLDEHDDAEHGKVTRQILELIAHNNNKRTRQNKYTALILGHTRLPARPGDPMPPEHEQPEIIGYASDWFVAPDPAGLAPCLWATEYHLSHAADRARGYPYRSIERLAPSETKENPSDDDHFADRVSLLRTPPRRDFGPIFYQADPHGLIRTLYCRCQSTAPETETESSTDMFDHNNPAHVKALAEGLKPHLHEAISAHYHDPAHAQALAEHLKPHIHSALNEMIAPADETPDEGAGSAPQGVAPDDDMADDSDMDGDGIADDMDDDADGDGIDDDLEDDPDLDRERYGAELGGDNGVIPAMVGDDDDEERDRMMNSACSGSGSNMSESKSKSKAEKMTKGSGKNKEKVMVKPDKTKKAQYAAPETVPDESIDRKMYQRDLEVLSTSIEDLYERLGRSELDRVRLLYAANLRDLRDKEGFEVDIDEEVSMLPIDKPEEYVQQMEKHIRKNYRRTIVSQPVIPVGERKAEPEPLTEQKMIKARGYATMHRCSFEEALAKLGFA